MADFIIKKWNTGTSSFDELYPKTTHTQIVATGTPSSTTFLRGDGTWAVPDGVDNYVNITGDTMTGNLTISNALPTIQLVDTDHNSDFEIKNSNGNLVITDTTNSRNITTFHNNGNVYNTGQTINYGNITISNGLPKLVLDDSNSTNSDFNLQNDDGVFAIEDSTNSAKRFTIISNGNVGIGTTTPSSVLTLSQSMTSSPYHIFMDTTGTSTLGGGAGIIFGTSASATETNYNAKIEGIRTTSNDGSSELRFSTTDVTTSATPAERMRITEDGNVGIGTTTPSAQLQVKSGATDRVPLIVDSVASLTANLQEWKINGSDKAFLDSAGYFRSPGIRSSGSTNNSQIDTATTGTTISRNVADTNPALTVNLANGSATGDIVKFQKAGTTLATISNNGEITAPKFYLSADSDGANEIPNWAFSEYNNKPCVSSEYISDTYYPIYHEGNMPPGSWTEIYGGETAVTGGTGTTTVTLSSGSLASDDIIAIEFHTIDTEGTYSTSIQHVKLGSASSNLYSTVMFPSYDAGINMRITFARVWLASSTQVSFSYGYYTEIDGSPTVVSDTFYVGKIWKINGVTGV